MRKEPIGLKYPTRVSINITRQCNLHCKLCLSSSGKSDSGELTTEELFDLIDQMKKVDKPLLAIGGGEPLIRKDIFQVIAYARMNGIPVSIVTNSLLVTEQTAELLESLDLYTITVSIDGLEKNHDLVRGKGNFKRAIEKIKILRKYCKTTKLAMRVTVNTCNLKDCKKLIKLAETLSFDTIRLTPALPLGRAKENQNLLISQEQYIQFLKDCHGVKSKIQVLLPDQSNKDPEMIRQGEFGCHCGKETCWITQTGELYPCIFFGKHYVAGNIRDESFLSLWKKAKEMVRLCGNDTCNTCGNYKNCRGGCRSRALWLYNDINAIDPYCPLKKNKL